MADRSRFIYMSDFKTRLIDEKEELSVKANKLEVFLASDGVLKIDPTQLALLKAQLPAMKTYLTILQTRIDLLN